MRTTLELLSDGWRALVKELGLGDALRYKVLFQPGRGEYARERVELFGQLTLQDLEKELRAWEASTRSHP
jgi:hypothetical protein